MQTSLRNVTASELRTFERDEALMQAARRRWEGKSAEHRANWVLSFAKRDIRALAPDARVALGYDLRVLTGDAIGWGVRRKLGPMPDRDLREVRDALRAGIAALDATKVAHPVTVYTERRAGWTLPAHRVRLVFMAAPVGAANNPTALRAIYEAADETAAIVARLGYLLLQEDLRWRICPCGCGEKFIKEGKQQYATPECATRARQKRWRRANRERATR